MRDTNPTSAETPRKARTYPAPNLPNQPSYIPGYAAIPLVRFIVDLFVCPTAANWLVLACLVDGSAVLFSALAFLGIAQTNGLSWPSLVAWLMLVGLIALEVVCYRAWRRRAAA